MLVYYEMADDTQTASANIALEKARTSATYRRPTKELEDNIAAGRVAVLGLPGATPIEGGLPIVVGGKMIGAIGVSGVTSAQDGQVARAGVEALAK
jgi:glc operon protein GlcG